jgi:hypothetical protein
MNPPTKQTLLRIIENRPVYRVMPPGGLRTYAALKYHGQHSPNELGRLVRSMGALPTRWLPTALLAARAAFRTGQDDLLETALSTLERRHAGSPDVHVLRADLLTYRGAYAEALSRVELARQLRPSSVGAAARIVSLSYRSGAADADERAVDAVRRFPVSPTVMWPVAMACRSPEQLDRVSTAWHESVADPGGLLRVVRQLSVAASRAGRPEAGVEFFRRAILLVHESGRTAPVTVATKLGGLGASGAIDDLARVFQGARVRFFFAAGTALGLVREGRPLGADGDIDVGVFAEDWDRDTLIGAFTRDPRFDLDLHPLSGKIGLRHRGGSPIDVFRFYREGDRVWHDGVFVRWHNSPFEVVGRPIGGRDLPLPADADRYLTENYGDWRTPNPTFDAFTDDAPNVEVTQPAYQRLHFARRAYDQLARRQVDRARHFLTLAGEDALAVRLGPVGRVRSATG